MDIFKILYYSLFSPLKILTREKEKGRLAASCIIVAAAALSGSVAAPAAYYFTFKNTYDLDFSVIQCLNMLVVSMATWLAACAVLFSLSLVFGKGIGFKRIASTWGLSYIPNLICILAYNGLQLNDWIFTDSPLAAFLVNTIFIMLLVWKAIFYFMEMRFVIKVTGLQLLIMTSVTGIAFFALMSFGFAMGIQVPML